MINNLTQERNIEEHKNKVWVYPSVALRFHKCRREDNATHV